MTPSETEGERLKDAWNPGQYERFRDERRQPFFDLLALVQRRPSMQVVDLGCGTGVLTRTLHRELLADESRRRSIKSALLAAAEPYSWTARTERLLSWMERRA